jgi:HD-GYP domain-containing protein (c-di-GMP phosphodiesterase class II)
VGEEIPFESRIILVVDAFEATASDPPHSPGIAVEERWTSFAPAPAPSSSRP